MTTTVCLVSGFFLHGLTGLGYFLSLSLISLSPVSVWKSSLGQSIYFNKNLFLCQIILVRNRKPLLDDGSSEGVILARRLKCSFFSKAHVMFLHAMSKIKSKIEDVGLCECFFTNLILLYMFIDI